MKLLRNILIWSFVTFAVIPSFASTGMFLKIEGTGGYTKVIPLDCYDGSCKRALTKIENFKAGTYTFTVTNEHGQALKVEDKPMRRFASVKLSAQVTSEEYANAVIAAAAGTPTAQLVCTGCSREIYIEKQVPAGRTFSETIEIAADGILLVDFGGFWEDGEHIFADDWGPQVN